MMDTQDPWLLHFTHVNNLRGIAAQGLLADNRKPSGVVECGEDEIKKRRRERFVPIGPKGTVADYAPFYFAARSPMLRRIHGGKVKGYQEGQTLLIYLVTRFSRITAANLSWVATDRNATIGNARFTDQRAELPTHVDWEVMEARLWANTVEDGSRMQRRMAEFLVYGGVPWTVFSRIYTHDEPTAEKVREIISDQEHSPPVGVRAWWYF